MQNHREAIARCTKPSGSATPRSCTACPWLAFSADRLGSLAPLEVLLHSWLSLVQTRNLAKSVDSRKAAGDDVWMKGHVLGLGIVASLLIGAPNAGATFPGKNGLVAYEWLASTYDEDGIESYESGITITDVRDAASPSRSIDGEDPAWSPDGSQLAVARDGKTGSAIWIMNADGTEAEQVTSPSNGSDREPSWSSDGALAFTRCEVRADCEIWTIELQAQAESQVTDNAVDDGQPNWSPSGSMIVAHRELSRDRQGLFIHDPIGGVSRRLLPVTNDGALHGDPSWHPSSRRIVFAIKMRRWAGWDIFSVRFDGERVRRHTKTNRSEVSPVYSPDGRRIAFARGCGIYLMSSSVMSLALDGVETQVLSHEGCWASDLDWQPTQ